MEQVAASTSTPVTVAFADGLGERRLMTDPAGNDTLELLCLRGELAAVPSFEFALRERVSRLATFRHASFGRVRSVERLNDRGATLAVVSERTPGLRLSDLLAHAEERHLNLDINTALCLIRQLVPAIALLHESVGEAPGIAHGAIGPERLVVTPSARLIVVEYVMGAALEQLRFSRERYWTDLRIALPRAAGLPTFDHRADVTQVGIVALSLILGRPLRDDEYPSRVADVVASTWAQSARGGFEPLPPGLRGWLGRALQLDARTAFRSAVEARDDLDRVLGDSDYIASPDSLEAFLARYHAAVEPPSSRPAPAMRLPVPQPIAVTASVPQPVTVVPLIPVPLAVAPAAPAMTTPEFAHAAPPAKREPVAAPRYRPRQPAPEPEAEPVADRDGRTAGSRRHVMRPALAGLLLVALAAGGGFAARGYFAAAPAAATTGTLAVSSNPNGADVIVDGQTRGMTPLTLTLPPGPHMLELRGPGEPRSIPVTIVAGTQVAQYIELAAGVSETGQLHIRTDPPGAQVSIDGTPRGVSPLTATDLSPGEHAVVVESELGSIKQAVTVQSGMTASLVVPLSAPQGALVSGWISVSAPVDVQLYEQGRLVGTSQSDRIMVSAGRHEIEMVNEALGYRATRVVQVPAGKVAAVTVEMPRGTIALNALPWAEVWIDGERVGETPLGNVPVTIGAHQIVFRHPELGEQQHTVTVTLSGPSRLSVDLRKK